MAKNPLRELLNRMFWDSKMKASNFALRFRHRGAPNDTREITCARIVKVHEGSFTFMDDSEETTIPFHRVLDIRNSETGKKIWRSRKMVQ